MPPAPTHALLPPLSALLRMLVFLFLNKDEPALAHNHPQIHSLRFILGIIYSMALDKWTTYCHYYTVIQSNRTALKIVCAPPFIFPP